MADIALQKPAAGQSITLTPQSEDRLVLNFDPSEATLTREGDNLTISFEDGSQLSLDNFYQAYDAETMPEFVIGDEVIPGEAFFAALDEELMPAAGAAGAQGSGSSVDFVQGTLLDGIDRTGRLDQEYPDIIASAISSGATSLDEITNQARFSTTAQRNDEQKNTPPIDSSNPEDTDDNAPSITGTDTNLTSRDDSVGQGPSASGKLEFTPGDGGIHDQKVTITLEDGTEHELEFDENNQAKVETESGTITFTRPTEPSEDGSSTLEYEYEQNESADHSKAEDDTVTESFKVTITDGDGDSTTSEDIVITIVDDAPETMQDSNTITEGDASIGGNILDNDDMGADGGSLSSVTLPESGMEGWSVPEGWTASDNELAKFESDKGSITIHPDGSYTFDYTDNSLTEGQTEDFTFNYTVTDKDGDSSSNSLTITAQGSKSASITASSDMTVTEENMGLEDASSTGSLEFIPGDGSIDDQKITITLDDGTEHALNFSESDQAQIETEYGTLTFTRPTEPGTDGSSSLEYSYEQNKSFDHGSTEDGTLAKEAESFKVTITDEDGDSTTSEDIVINIVDDVPEIENFTDLDSVTEGGSVTGSLDVDFGADGKGNDAFSVEGSIFEDGKGWVVDGGHINFDGNGEFTFTAAPDVPKGTIAEFTIVATDADGDSVQQDVSVTINQQGAPTIDDSDFVVGEAGLSQGTGTNEDGTNTGATITVDKADWLGENNTAPEGTYEVKVGDQVVGNATVNKDGSITVELKDNVDHNSSKDGSLQDLTNSGRVTVVVNDAAGNPHDITLDVKIKDDAPEVEKSLNTTTDSDVATTLVRIDFGADDGEGKSITFDDGSTFTFESGEWIGSDGGTVSFSEPDASGKVTTTLTGADGTELSNYADPTSSEPNPVWTAKVTDVPEEGSKTQSFMVKDADGDTTSFDITATQSKEDTSSDLVGVEGSGSQFTPGQDYNIAFILDTSGSMYDDANHDIKGTVTESGNIIEAGDEATRLGQALEAIYDFVETTLFSHGNSELGGNVNILLTTFWGYSGEQGQWYNGSQINNENDGVDIVLSFKEGLSEADLKADILDQLKALYDSQVKGDSDGSSLDGRDEGFHWGTCYGKGFSSAAEWFESLGDNGAINETFFMSDGAPTAGEIGRDEAYLALEKAMGLKDENGNDIEDSDSKIHAIGIGSGVSKGTLDKYDSDGDATIITDSNIKDMFNPETGETTTTTFSSSVGITGSGDDVALGGMGADVLKAALESMLGYEVSDKDLIEYMQNHPEWILEQDLASSLANDPDLLVTGAGDDLVYGQGGDDVLMGDGHADKLEAFAEQLGMSPEQSQEYSADALENTGDDAQDLVINLHDAAQAAEVGTLIDAAAAMESDTDGHDNLYGGSGNDLLLGLGGNDHLSGGSGNDILLGGSGDDYLSGGEGSDILLGGSGNDVIRMDMDDILVDGGMDVDGTDMDVLLIDNASLEAVKDKMQDGSIDNMEVVIAGDVAGTSTEEVLQNAGAQDAEGNWLVNQEGSSWTASEGSQTIGGREFMEFTNEADNITILVEATKLEIGSA